MARQHLVGFGLPLLDPLLAVEEVDDLRPEAVVARVVNHLQPLTRPGNIHLENTADLGARTVGEHHDPIGEKHRFIHVMGDHDSRECVLIANLHELLLQIAAGQGIEGSKRFIQQEQFGLDRQRTGDGHPLAHAT